MRYNKEWLDEEINMFNNWNNNKNLLKRTSKILKKKQIKIIIRKTLVLLYRNFIKIGPLFSLLCVCLSVCPQATGHTVWSRNLIFWLWGPYDMCKKCFFFQFWKFLFLRILCPFFYFWCFFQILKVCYLLRYWFEIWYTYVL